MSPGGGIARVRDVRVRRVYEQASPDDGQRFLVDRLWPRGLAKSAAHLDEWVLRQHRRRRPAHDVPELPRRDPGPVTG
jgi:hypothetical protein